MRPKQVLRARADTGDGSAAEWLADLLAERGDIDELRVLADTGDWFAADRLAGQPAERDDLEELWAGPTTTTRLPAGS